MREGVAREFAGPSAVVVKHNNPCGAASATTLADAFRRAWDGDPQSAFGGILAFNRALDRATAEALGKQFGEVVIAPRVEPEAKAALATKANVRVLEVPIAHGVNAYDFKRVGGGMLVQGADAKLLEREEARLVTKKAPSDAQWADLLFAWRAVRGVKSNAILIARDRASVGVGMGQVNRVDAARLAVQRAGDRAAGAVAASDAYFPFPDGLGVLAQAGVRAVVEPGGSVRDAQVIAAAEAAGISLYLTGTRHFAH